MKKHIITLAGRLGSGKSSTGNVLAERLGYKRFSMGDIQRQYAEKLGMDFVSYTEMQKKDHTIDKQVDAYQQEIAKSYDNFILDSRLGWYFIPESFKVFLELPIEISAERIINDAKTNPTRLVEIIGSKEEVIQNIQLRIESEQKRYKDLYGIEDHFDHRNFDIVIRTDIHSLPEVVNLIQTAYEQWLISE